MSETDTGCFVTDLRARGYAVLPAPRNVQLEDSCVRVDAGWALSLNDVADDDIAARELTARLRDEFALALSADGDKSIRLSIQDGAVDTGAGGEADGEAYRLTIAADGIEIVANAAAGLFWGVQTLCQLLEGPAGDALGAPVGVITDWPTYPLRIVHWDTKHHQDRPANLRRLLDWAARYKFNAIAFELEDKFAYPTNPIIGAPGAMTTQQLQELVRYALERHVQIIPTIQAPAHLCYALKHPQFAHLRCDGSNYVACVDDPEAMKLIFEMYEDILEATPGVKYFLVSTDEVYYSGICETSGKPYNPENRSLKWLDFVKDAFEFLTARGREVIIWAEHPLLPEHVKLLPEGIIDGVGTGREVLIAVENECGVRQIGYASMQGEELLFPNYFNQADERHLTNRLVNAYEAIVRRRGEYARSNWIGTFAAAWGDAGLHNETFWLAWAAMAQNSWTGGAATVEQTIADFMDTFYGHQARGMVEVYHTLQGQARFWEDAMIRTPSRVRGPAYGNHLEKRPITRTDRTLTTPALPEASSLAFEPAFTPVHAQAVAEAPERLLENDRLIALLHENLTHVRRNRHNLEVLLSLAHLVRHGIALLTALGEAEDLLTQAAQAATKGDHAAAADSLARAHHRVGEVIDDLYIVYGRLVKTWEKTHLPRNATVDGREFVHVMDDVKDHFADRRTDLSYMIAPAESIGLPDWRDALGKIIADYAGAHDVPINIPGPTVVE